MKGAVISTAAVLSGFSALSDYALDTRCPFVKYRKTAPFCGRRVTITAFDGIKLSGCYIGGDSPARIVIAFHGWRSAPARDFAAQRDLLEGQNCGVLYVDMRAQGESGGRYMGFGLLERFDCVSWVNFIREKTSLPLYLIGVSMGGSTVIFASELLKKGAVNGIIADCAFTSADEIWRHRAGASGIAGDIISKVSVKLAQSRAGFNARSRKTTDALERATVPFLFFHGENDDFVPTGMGYENYMACASPARLVTVKGARHAASCKTDPGLYGRELARFFDDNDKGKY